MKLSKRVQRIKPSPTMALTTKANAMKAEGLDVIGFAAGEPDFDTPVPIKQAAIKAIESGFTKYTPVDGTKELKQAIINKIKSDHNLDYTLSEIIVSNGGKHVLYNIAQVLFEEGDEVIIPAPYWVSYPDQVLLNDATPVIIDTTDKTGFKVLPEQLERAINSKTKAFILNSPSNPTGAAYSKADLEKLAAVLVKHQVICISDDIYEKVVYDGFVQTNIASLSPAMKELTIIANGASKAYSMTGWRMGYAAGPKQIIAAMNKVQGQVTSNICSITQKACVEAYQGSDEAIHQMVSEFDKRRKFIVNAFNQMKGITCYNPQGAFYVFPNVSGLFGKTTPKGKKIKSAADFAEYLLEDYLIVGVPGEGFGTDEYVRFSYATSMANIEKGIKRISEAVKALKD